MIDLSGLGEAEKRAYILADKELALNAGWSDELLAAEVADLDAVALICRLAGSDPQFKLLRLRWSRHLL